MIRTVAAVLARVVAVVSGLAALILIAYIALVYFKADPHNAIVRDIGRVARPLAWSFKGLFSPHTMRERVAVNYGLAAVVYFVAGRIVIRLLRIGRSFD